MSVNTFHLHAEHNHAASLSRLYNLDGRGGGWEVDNIKSEAAIVNSATIRRISSESDACSLLGLITSVKTT